MNKQRIIDTVLEAKRFIRVSEECILQWDEYSDICGNKYTGSCRRASMDLTRKLSDMRNRNYK